MSTNSNPFVRAAQVLKQAKLDIASIFTDPDLGAVKASVDSSLDMQVNRLNHLSGDAIENTDPVASYPPITNFMGEDISPDKPIAVSDLHVSRSDKDAYIERVEALYAGFDTMVPDSIVMAHTIPEDQLVLRGVAKKAGLPNYKDFEINNQSIADLQQIIRDKNVRDANDDAERAQLVATERINNLTGQLQIAQEKEASAKEAYGAAAHDVENSTTAAKREAAQKRLDKATLKLEEVSAERVAIENQLKAADPLNALPGK